ncbi:MAG: hypothetical protein ACOY0T_07165 [Myxococcota bacterium]
MNPAPGTAAVSECDYRVQVMSANPLLLDVAATCQGRAVRGLESDDARVASAVRSLTSDRGPVQRSENAFLLASEARRVTFRYHVDLDALARETRTSELALRSGESLIAPSSSFLLYPWPLDIGIPVRVTIDKPAALGFASGLTREGDHYRLEAHEIPVSTYSAFGKLKRSDVAVDAAHARLEIVALGDVGVDFAALTRWAGERAHAVANFYGGFPAPRASLFVVPIAGRRDVVFGNLKPESSPGAALLIGAQAGEHELAQDWVLVHELFHIGVPSFHAEGKWFDEGLATYFEPIIRVRAGLLDPLQAWREFALEMPRRRRALTHDGLEHTNEIYWGGAIFCLLADIEARRASGGRLGLEDGVRNVLRAGGNASEVWRLQKTLELADRVFERPVLVPLWKRYAARPAALELDAIFQELGVVRAASGITLSDTAPLAWVRRAIFEASPARTLSATR